MAAEYFFISPHFDDAIFSAGGLISRLKSSAVVQVINVFTTASPARSTLSGRAFLHQCRFSDAVSLYKERQAEDKRVFSRLGISPINLGFTEALWRSFGNMFGKIIPEMGAVYPTYRWHIISGRISPRDSPLMDQLLVSLKNIIPADATVFCPLSINNHVDHLIVRQVCSQLSNKTVYWLDYPYSRQNLPAWDFILRHHLKKQTVKINPDSKIQLMQGYKSQFPAIFPRGIISLPAEIYYL